MLQAAAHQSSQSPSQPTGRRKLESFRPAPFNNLPGFPYPFPSVAPGCPDCQMQMFFHSPFLFGDKENPNKCEATLCLIVGAVWANVCGFICLLCGFIFGKKIR